MQISIRDAMAADAPLCRDLYARAVLEGAGAHYTEAERRAWVGNTTNPPWMAERIVQGRGWVAERAGQGVGFLVSAGLATGDAVHLDLFFVVPEARGGGAASALYTAFEAAAGTRPMTAFASLYLRPFLERRGWRVLRADLAPRSGEVLMRFEMARDAGLRGS